VLPVLLYCTLLLGVTIESEAGMTIYGQCWCQVKSAHCTSPLNVCKVYVLYEWCAAAVTILTAHVSLLGEHWAVCLRYTAWRPVSSSAGLYAIPLSALSGPWPARLPDEVIAGSSATVVTGAMYMAERYLLSDHPYSLWCHTLLFLSIMACYSLMRRQPNPLCPSENVIS